MKKIVAVALLLLTIAFTLTGCISNEVGIEVDDDGGKLTYTWKVDKATADAYYGERLPATIKNAEVIEQDGKTYYSKITSAQYSSLGELRMALENLCLFGEDGINLFEDVYVDKNRIALTTSADFAPTGSDGVNGYITLDLTVKMPRRVTVHTLGTVLEDGKTVSIHLEDLSTAHLIDVTCAADYSAVIAIASGVVILGCGAAALLIHRRQRKRAEAMPDIPVDEEKNNEI